MERGRKETQMNKKNSPSPQLYIHFHQYYSMYENVNAMALHKAEQVRHCDLQRDLPEDLSVLKSPHCRLKLTQQGKAAPFLAYTNSSRSLMGQSRTCICVSRTKRSAHFLPFTKRCDTNGDYLMLTKEISEKSSHKNITEPQVCAD